MKLKDNRWFWLILRVALIALILWGVVNDPEQDQFVNWTAAWLVPPAVGAMTYFYFNLIGWRQEVDLSEPLTFTKPFWPMTIYPTRFFALNAFGGLVGGSILVIREIGAGAALTPFPVIILGTGIAIYAAIWVAGLMIDKGYK